MPRATKWPEPAHFDGRFTLPINFDAGLISRSVVLKPPPPPTPPPPVLPRPSLEKDDDDEDDKEGGSHKNLTLRPTTGRVVVPVNEDDENVGGGGDHILFLQRFFSGLGRNFYHDERNGEQPLGPGGPGWLLRYRGGDNKANFVGKRGAR